MKRLSMKKILLILIIALLVVSVSSVCFAGTIPVDPDEFQGDAGSAGAPIMSISNLVLGIAQVIGVAVAVIILVILAIKYISAAPSEKGEIKKSAFVYIIGALLLFGGVAVLRIIQNAAEDAADLTGAIMYQTSVYETNTIYKV